MRQLFITFQHSVLIQIIIILAVSSLFATVANLIHPHSISWVQDWKNYVETKARNEGVEVVTLSVAYEIYADGSHLFVDARSTGEYKNGYIPTSVSLPFNELDKHLDTLEMILSLESPVIVYCSDRDCDDALLLALELRDMGKSDLLYFVDGFKVWKESGCSIDPK